MDRITIDITEREHSQIQEEAMKNGMTEEEFVKASVRSKLPVHELSDDEIGAIIREENKELYRRLS
jgi:hypothetical protein